MSHPHQEVDIEIDRKQYKSPNPTTGAALYTLGGVKPGYDLYLETHGPKDDELIPNNGHQIELKEWNHFYSSPQTLNPGSRNGAR